MPSVAPVGLDVPGYHESMPETKVISFADSGSEFFENLLDIINPLQHIPVVSTIYRAITGDEIAPPARLLGGALFGGPLGLASAVGNLFLEEATGDDLAGHALALIDEFDDTPELANAAAPAAMVTRTAPLAAAQLAVQSSPQVATNLSAADGGVEIIWNGPRVVPSLARSTAAIQGATANDTALGFSSAARAPASDTSPTERAARPAGPDYTSIAAPNLAARPVWLDAAIADAQSVQNTKQDGKAAQKVAARPWLTEAMLEALGKYQRLTLERNR